MLNKLKRLFKFSHQSINNTAVPRSDESLSKRIDGLNVIEKDIIKNIIELTEVVGEDIMVHRPNMVCLSDDQSIEALWKIVEAEPFSYYPVYDDNLDDIKGYVHVYDLAKLMINNPKGKLTSIICPIIFIPASIPVLDILMKMQHAKAPIVIMVDEHGGTDGLLCINDIIYNAMSMNTELDNQSIEELYFERIDINTIIVEGQYALKDLVDETGIVLTVEEQEEELDTVNGLIQYLIGRVPDRSEIVIHEHNYEFEILESSPRAVLKVKITRINN